MKSRFTYFLLASVLFGVSVQGVCQTEVDFSESVNQKEFYRLEGKVRNYLLKSRSLTAAESRLEVCEVLPEVQSMLLLLPEETSFIQGFHEWLSLLKDISRTRRKKQIMGYNQELSKVVPLD